MQECLKRGIDLASALLTLKTRELQCNVPDPLTGEEDATNTNHTGKQPHEQASMLKLKT